MKDNSGKILLALLAGASAGVIAGLLMAPDTGEATRDTLRKSASKMGKDLESRLQPILDKLSDLNAGAILNSITGNDQGGNNNTGGGTTGAGTTRTAGTAGTGTGTAGTGGATASRVGGTTTSGGTATSGGGAGAGGVS